jgi:hypothetical protein
MPISSVTWSWDRAAAYGLPKLIAQMRDSVSGPPTFEAFRKLGAVVPDRGGSTILFPLRHTAINVQVVGSNPLSITPPNAITDILSAASYDWAELYAQVAIDNRDINKVSNSPERAATMMQRYAESAVRDFYKAINSALHASGTGTETSHGGFGYYLDGGNTGTLGGIAKSNTWWKARQKSSVGTMSIDKLDSWIVELASDYESPQLFVSTPAIISKLRSLLQAGERVVNKGGDDQEFGALAVSYAGVLLVADAACASGTGYLINTNSIKVYVDSSEPKMEKVAYPAPAQIWNVVMFSQLVAGALADSLRATGIT